MILMMCVITVNRGHCIDTWMATNVYIVGKYINVYSISHSDVLLRSIGTVGSDKKYGI